ncbi:MAG: hypothetical protein QM808_05875 [Steroidobacteraceae bacterium]
MRILSRRILSLFCCGSALAGAFAQSQDARIATPTTSFPNVSSLLTESSRDFDSLKARSAADMKGIAGVENGVLSEQWRSIYDLEVRGDPIDRLKNLKGLSPTESAGRAELSAALEKIKKNCPQCMNVLIDPTPSVGVSPTVTTISRTRLASGNASAPVCSQAKPFYYTVEKKCLSRSEIMARINW